MRATNFLSTGEEDEDVPVGKHWKQAFEGGQHLLLQGPAVRPVQVGDVHGKGAAFGGEDGAATEKRGEGARLERGGHHQELQRVARPLELTQKRQGQVPLQVPLVELVQHHRAHAAEPGVGHQPPREDAFGDEAQPRPGTRALLETYLVAHRLAQRLAALLGDARRRQPRREAAGLQHPHLSVADESRVEQGRGDARRLPGAGSRLQHRGWAVAERLEDLRQEPVDGECGTGPRAAAQSPSTACSAPGTPREAKAHVAPAPTSASALKAPVPTPTDCSANAARRGHVLRRVPDDDDADVLQAEAEARRPALRAAPQERRPVLIVTAEAAETEAAEEPHPVELDAGALADVSSPQPERSVAPGL